MRNKELELFIYNYIKDHESDHIDIVDLVCIFPSKNKDKILDTINTLRINKYIDRISIGIYYYYKILRNYEDR